MSKQTVCDNTRWCSICGLRIPDSIVSPEHPLFGTVDHVIPKAKGGLNVLANRRAAHRMCNWHKGVKTVLDYSFVCWLQSKAEIQLRKIGAKTGPVQVRNARARIGLRKPAPPPQEPRHVMRWEDEGGAVA